MPYPTSPRSPHPRSSRPERNPVVHAWTSDDSNALRGDARAHVRAGSRHTLVANSVGYAYAICLTLGPRIGTSTVCWHGSHSKHDAPRNPRGMSKGRQCKVGRCTCTFTARTFHRKTRRRFGCDAEISRTSGRHSSVRQTQSNSDQGLTL